MSGCDFTCPVDPSFKSSASRRPHYIRGTRGGSGKPSAHGRRRRAAEAGDVEAIARLACPNSWSAPRELKMAITYTWKKQTPTHAHTA